MTRAHPFVSVAAADLVHALEPTHDEALEVELGRDSHVEAHVERVVVGDEGARGGSSDEGVHRRRLDLEKIARVEDLAGCAHDVASRAKDIDDRRIGDEVDITLAVPELDVGQSVPLLGQGPQRLRHET